jgi:FkbM family methyltransferase
VGVFRYMSTQPSPHSSLRRTIRLRTRVRRFLSAPRLVREHFRFAFRQALMHELVVPMWVTSPPGTRFCLSKDMIDDQIVRDLLENPSRFFPGARDCAMGSGGILDIGGHHGLYAAEALRRYPDRKLIVVEPHPAWCALIKKNLAANGGEGRSRIVKACLASDNVRRTLRFDADSSWGATVQTGSDGTVAIEVESLTLPQILAGEPVAMIYCNAEGAEYALAPQLRQYTVRPAVMVICVHPEFGDAGRLRREFCQLGYTEIDVSPSAQRPAFHYTRNGP